MYRYTSCILFCIALFLVVDSKNIAIIGGGIGGSAAAHFTRSLFPEGTRITLFEKDSRIGGRLMSVEFDGYRQEIGADVCHVGNYYCVEFAQKVGFNVSSRTISEDGNGLAILNGSHYLFKSKQYSWKILNILNLVKIFGIDLFYLEGYVRESFDKWQTQYSDQVPWNSLNEFLERYQLGMNMNISLSNSMKDRKFSAPLIEGLVSAISKVIYQLEADAIHALAGQISITGSLKTEDLFTIPNGNELMAQYLVNTSSLDLRLNHEVLSITREGSNFIVESRVGDTITKNIFQGIILASPLELSQIRLNNLPQQPLRKYITLYVTILRCRLNYTFWNIKEGEVIQDQTMQAYSKSPHLFTSMSINHVYTDGTALVKLFSPNSLKNELPNMFNDFDQSRVYEKLWRPYPVLEPGIALPDIEITPGLYYSSAFESVGSSIEVSILSARNAARLLLQHFKGNMGPESKEIQEKRKSEL